ncbi:MAG TPA: YbaB/EbfC family nucleoid-associated protein [candidate division Zixibacteria bacterium]|nr:YbaB/EbfC family nucleoid-associated protein [candidate division Zixibacteria bacterium]
MGEIGGLLKQMQQMQSKVDELQKEMEALQVEGSAGGGMVTATCNGKHELLSITIDKEVIDPQDPEMLQDLIVAAVNQARQKASEAQAEKMSELTGGLNIPGLTLPF